MYYDSHIHSTFSADGVSAVKEYIKLLDEGILRGIGFAEHTEFMPECGSYGYLDPDRYFDEIRYYKCKGYEIHAGAEIDYNKKVEKEIISHLSKYEYAFTICSVHIIDGTAISDRTFIPSLNDRNILLRIMDKYYSELRRSLNIGILDVTGHIGVYKRYLRDALKEDRGILDFISEAEGEIARLCAQSGKILEVNSSGLFSPLARTLPDEAFLRLFYSFGGRSVCAGSDAHRVSDAGKGIDIVYDILRSTGFEYVTLPWDKQHPVRL